MPDALTQQANARLQARIAEQSATINAQMDAAVAALTARVAALEARRLTSHSGSATIPALAVGGSTTVTITWPTPFSDAQYTCSDPLLSPALVGKCTGTIQSQTAAGCVVKLTTSIAVSLGSTVSVTALRYT